MHSLALLLGLFQLSVSVRVVCSVLTPAPLLSALALPCLSYEEVLELEGVDMLLDAYCEQLKTERLAAFCEERQTVLMVLRPFKPGKWTFVDCQTLKYTYRIFKIDLRVIFQTKKGKIYADCYFSCWSPRHFTIIGITVGTMIVFITVSTWQRVKWQESTIVLNVKCGVVFLALKSPLMMLTTVFSQAFRSSFPVLHAFLHLTILVLYLLFCLKWNTYLYGKVRISHNILLILCMWSTALAVCTLLATSVPALIFPLVTVLGWLVLLLLRSYEFQVSFIVPKE